MFKFIQFLFLIFLINFYLSSTCAFSIKNKRSAQNDQFSPSMSTTLRTVEKKTNLLIKCDPCPRGIECVPLVQCPAHVRLPTNQKPQLCDLPGGSHGYCCTSGQNHTMGKLNQRSGSLAARSTIDETHEYVNKNVFETYIEEARSAFAGELQKEKTMSQQVQRGHPAFFHNLVFRSSPYSEMKSRELSHRAMERVYVSQVFKKREHIPVEDFELGQVKQSLDGTYMENTCNPKPSCSKTPKVYRPEDGQCNNEHPGREGWGAAGTPMERLLPPYYEDGIWEPRKYSVHGSYLTNPRTIARQLFKDADRPHHLYNLLFMQFGQFITHDISQSSSIKMADGKSINCCTEDGSAILPEKDLHYSCMPIEIEGYDDFYTQYNQRCINFVRSALSPSLDCKLGYGKQLSKATHYLDGSAIYGSDLKTQGEVRYFKGGLLRMSEGYGRALLPIINDKSICGREESGCFETGDARSNQIISLTALHTIFAREHNRIARILSEINPHWTDDTLFYETRSIVIAKFQHIVYNEWLPYAIGSETMEKFGLYPIDHGYSTSYDPEVNACVTSEFTTAAFRFGHSVVDGKFRVNHGDKTDEIVNIPDVMFNTGKLKLKNYLDELLNTLTHQPMQSVDCSITQGLSGFLFRGEHPFGLDLAAINIHRGREHGMRCYNDYLEVIGQKRITDFKELGEDNADVMSKVYKHPDDIDLWVGGLSEKAKGDALLGPTFSEIIADQFTRLKKGDRYFYDLSPDINPGYFSINQLNEIRTTTMARIICDNVDGYALQEQAPKAFIQAGVEGNNPVPCDDVSSIPIMYYDPWKE